MRKKKASDLNYADTHRAIVEQCQKGDRQAQFALYKQYNKAMYNTCLRMLKNSSEAEDTLQTAFVQVFRKIDTFRYESSIGAWIKKIVVNHCINTLKKKKLDVAQWDDKYDAISEEKAEPSLLKGTQVAAVKKAINQLSDGYRTVFNMYALEGYDHQEIASVLGISEATSKSQYCRARKKIKALLCDT